MDTGKALAKHNHSTDYFGIAIDVRKSDIQKAVRRGMFQQACSSFFAGYNLRTMFPKSTTALSVQTNFINRLMVIAVEDIGMANPNLIRTILPVLNEMSTRKIDRDPYMLTAIIHALVESPKSRLCSHLASVYRAANRKLAESKGVVFLVGAETITLDTPDCFTWLETKSSLEIFGWIQADPACVPHHQHFDLLQKVYKKASATFGQPAFLRYMLALAHYLNVKNERGEYVTAELTKSPYVLEPFSTAFVSLLIHPSTAVFLDPLEDSVDYHTKKGRSGGDSVSSLKKRFRMVGAEVKNAHPVMNDSVLEEIYKV